MRDADIDLFQDCWTEQHANVDPRASKTPLKRKDTLERAARSEDIVHTARQDQNKNEPGQKFGRQATQFATAPPSPTQDKEKTSGEKQAAEATSPAAEQGKLQALDSPRALPKQIRVRRPTKPLVPNKLANDILYMYEHPDAEHRLVKSPPAEAATTRTAVHLFALQPPEVYEETTPLPGTGQRKLSATLQVVRSRDSIYEVI